MRMRGLARVLLAVLLSPALLELAARPLPLGLPDLADLHLYWATADAPAFVERGARLETAPALVEQGNSRESFAREKAPGVKRIFCVGDSTTAGWPYNPVGSYPRWLAAILADARPDLRFEVVNAGFHGFDSTRCLSVARQVLPLSADAVIFHGGYNDHHLFPARRSGRLLTAHLWLARHSQAYNALRWLAGRRAGGYSLQPPTPRLSDAEQDQAAALYVANVGRLADAAREAGATLVLTDLPHASATQPMWGTVEKIRAGQRRLAAERGLTLATFDALGEERFVDHIHCDPAGYREIALDAARALERSGAFPGRWRWDLVRPAAVVERSIGFDDGEYQAHLHVRLAAMRLSRGQEDVAVSELVTALRAAPNARLVPEEILGSGNPALRAALARAQAARP